MHYLQARERIATGLVEPLYLFSGPEDYQKKILLGEILQYLEREGKPFYLEKVDGAALNFNKLIQETKQVTIFSNGRLLWVDNPSFLMVTKKGSSSKGKKRPPNKSEEKEIAGLLQRKLKNELIILSVPAVDRRKKLVKMLENANVLVEFPPLRGNALLGWVKNEFGQKGKKVEDGALHEFVQRVGEDLFLLKQEIEKIITYLSEEEMVTKPLIKLLVSESRQVSIFNLVDAVGRKSPETALFHLHNMLRQNEHPLVIFAMISRQFRLLYQVLLMQEKRLTLREIASSLRLPPFSVEEINRQARGFSKDELSRIMVYLKDTDLKIKTGLRQQDEVLQQLLLQLTIADWA